MTPLLEIAGLEAGYGGAPVLRGIDLALAAGDCVAIVGPGGAGKSTLIRTVMGTLPAQGGRLTFGGVDLVARPVEQRAAGGIALVPEGRRVFAGLSVTENLAVASRRNRAARQAAMARVFELFPDLAARPGERAWRLSGGQQQMLAIGRALMAEPKLILMDEPTLGLSPLVVRDVMAAVRRSVDGGTAVLVTEQSVGRIEGLGARVCRLEGGVLA